MPKNAPLEKIKMKKLLILLVLAFTSCGIPYDGETVVTLKLHLLNAANEPVSNQKGYIATSYGTDGYDFSTYRSRSNSDGIIQFALFKPNNTSYFILEEDPEYLPVSFYGLEENTNNGLNWDLGTLILLKEAELAPFTLYTNQVNANQMLYKIEIDAIKYENLIRKDAEPVYYDTTWYYQLKKNQNFILKYQVKDMATEQLTEYSIPLTIDATALTHTITY